MSRPIACPFSVRRSRSFFGRSARFRTACTQACVLPAALRHSLACGKPRRVKNRPRFGADGPLKRTRSAFKLARTMHQTCVCGAFRRLHAPSKIGHQRSKAVIPAHAAIQLFSETGPNSARKDAQVRPKCAENAFELARTMHQTCACGALRRLHAPYKTDHR